MVFVESPIGKFQLDDWIMGHTCGDAARLMVIACAGSGSVVKATNTAFDSPLQAATREPDEALAHIQSTFGLSITTLAGVLRVERPTIYSWLRSTSVPTPTNSERLTKLASLADHWLSVSGGSPLKDVRVEVLSGKSLLELLSEEHLRTFTAETAMRELWKRVVRQPARRRTLREIARARGITKDPTEFDALTGRRISEED